MITHFNEKYLNTFRSSNLYRYVISTGCHVHIQHFSNNKSLDEQDKGNKTCKNHYHFI